MEPALPIMRITPPESDKSMSFAKMVIGILKSMT